MFYCPNHSLRIVKTGNARFIENGEISGSIVPREVEIKEVRVQVPLACACSSKVVTHLGLSQKAYINKVLERFRMERSSASPVLI